jgi:hypothetical protein
MSDETRATQQLEKISRAVRDLEGLPVDFRLARKLSEIQRMIANMHPLPVAPLNTARHQCNQCGEEYSIGTKCDLCSY